MIPMGSINTFERVLERAFFPPFFDYLLIA